ncbi:MAG: SRPBCC family protein [Candidatus Longimicrobiales bacterium M2_2A_002]
MNLRWWHWILGIVAGLMVLILIAWAVGATLPVAHTATVSARIDAPPSDVWRLITEPARFAEWRPDVESVTVLDRDGTGIVWREALGTGAITFETTAWDPPRRMTARIADEGLPFGGSWTYSIEQDGDGAVLTITEDGEVYNPLFRFMSRFIFGHESTIRGYLDAVRAELGGA